MHKDTGTHTRIRTHAYAHTHTHAGYKDTHTHTNPQGYRHTLTHSFTRSLRLLAWFFMNTHVLPFIQIRKHIIINPL